MRWEIERYVKLYRRDTPEWTLVPWRAKGLFDEMLRKFDLDGRLECGRLSAAQAVAIAVGAPKEDVPEIEQLLLVLFQDGCVQDVPASGRRGRHLFMPNYRDAQGVALTGAERTAKWREEQEKRTQGASGDGGDEQRHARHKRHGDTGRGAAQGENPASRKPPDSRPKSPQADECDAVTDPAEPSRAETIQTSNTPQPPTDVTAVPRQAPARQARIGVGSPAFEAVEHWRSVAWPAMSTAPASPVTTPQAQRLAQLTGAHGIAEVRARMDRAIADPFWRDKLDLDLFLEKFDRFAPRRAAAAPLPDDDEEDLEERRRQRRRRGENPKPGDPDFNDPTAWLDYGEFLKRTDGRSAEEALGFTPPVYRPPKTPEEEAEERARSAAAKEPRA